MFDHQINLVIKQQKYKSIKEKYSISQDPFESFLFILYLFIIEKYEKEF